MKDHYESVLCKVIDKKDNMSLHFFTIPIADSKQNEIGLNQFIAKNKVIGLEKYFIGDGANSFWSICVTTTEAEAHFKTNISKGKRPSIDYKEVLSEKDFKVFAELRKLRKEISDAEGIPAYAVFSNEQLAKIVTQNIVNKAGLLSIDGIGNARVDKYATSFLACLLRIESNETSENNT